MNETSPAGIAPRLERRDVAELRRSYAIDASFERELNAAWEIIEPRIADIVRELLEHRSRQSVSDDLVAQRVAYARGKLAEAIDQRWVDRIVAEADRISERDLEFSVVAASMLVAQMRIHALFFELTSDPAQLQRLTRATQKLAVIETEIIVSRLRSIGRERNQAALRKEADAVRAELSAIISDTARAGKELVSFTKDTASGLQALRGPATEVAGGADQSASAMSQSAQSAAMLIGAYEAMRTEADAAADFAERAGSMAAEGAESAANLTSQTQRIGSVVTFIAQLAEQTQTLALNASIEASRAGESGRGFAVVAREVRNLADQASQAAEEIRGSIQEAQSASAATAEGIEAIRSVVTELVERVRNSAETVEKQMTTVSGILASIDETAVASREIASHISTISRQIDRLAAAADEANRQAASAGEALMCIDETVGKFMSGVGR